MDWKSKWGCECGAIWTSMDENPPKDRMCYALCPKPPLQRLPDKPLLTDAWNKRLGPENRA
jgi:hypothetical protein